ncbi:hypothetical protein VT06_13380 [Arsukibacterium sp. MJ3]|nr:hypothetical protein VT06_13380 [Arsukibacterium sp. MJ3]
MNDIKNFLQDRFPESATIGGSGEKTNAAIMLYGRRFYKDQTPVEYLAEFLLVFLSAKSKDGADSYTFEVSAAEAAYYPLDHVALKLFSFYPSSKLETRHSSHQKKYIDALIQIKNRLSGGTDNQKDDSIRILQSLFYGFTGVAKNRTWVTHSFLPASEHLISREVAWRHSSAKRDTSINTWDSSREYFDTSAHLFMARGGELLFLQLAHLFSLSPESIVKRLNIENNDSYSHLIFTDVSQLKLLLQKNLKNLLSGSLKKIDKLASFVEKSLSDVTLNDDNKPKKATLGWVPRASVPESFLFAQELNNICCSSLNELEKLDMMQMLCCLHVLRSLSFQARRLSQSEKITTGFMGEYAWIVSTPDTPKDSASRRLSQTSFEIIEGMLFRVLRIVHSGHLGVESSMKEADDHGFKIFRKIGKEIGLIIPKNGQGQRFVLSPTLLRLLVAAVIKPGERVRLTEFYRRIFAHFGIALAGKQLSVAIEWSSISNDTKDYAMTTESLWIEEALRQGGFLVELSDAVSIVYNSSSKEL